MTELRTERLLLRRPRPDDLDAMVAIMSDPRAMRFWSTLPHADREITRKRLEQMVARSAAGGEDFLIEFEGAVVGEVGAGRLPEFGFLLHPEVWGRGFATEAAAAFVDYAFTATATPELTADVDLRNGASLRVLDKLGFTETGRASATYLIGDEWCDSVYLTLPRA